jgi:hypothetical protein
MNSTNRRVTPWVHRHTAESWRERVKKRVAPFKLRVDAYLHDDVDETLCTKEERETGSIPAALRSEVAPEASSTTHRSASEATEKAVHAVPAVTRKTGNGHVAVESASKEKDTRKRSRQETDMSPEKETPDVPNKKAK